MKEKTPHISVVGKGDTCRIDRELLRGESEEISSWRIFKIMAELISGFELLRKFSLAATFYGSARFGLDNAYSKDTIILSEKLSKIGFAIITGGGNGIMAAANKGAYDAGGHSIGLNIDLPAEQAVNLYLTVSERFHYFFTRRVMLAFASEVYIFMPGGFGTLDEFFELITLVQTKKIKRVPIILFGKNYWEPLVGWFRTELLERQRTISKEDLDLFYVVDSVDEAYSIVVNELCGGKEKVVG